ncbi:P-II family nitrogen regulator [Effusibacillus dendaii]|uniref:Nitrogen regulatory protein P-II n=1 Tax=Effusibacillus dendaii TaxID=2743772 RepID=A0A7I8D879_9BACL|nr:P-II family nitrogen regulator [Effusibacillus dendaii]BCJ85219.1 nitrogen regulatory protein P-II [Effusibacillus dendaii]
MKKIVEAIIRPDQVDSVAKALSDLDIAYQMTKVSGIGYSHISTVQRKEREFFYPLPKIKLEIVVDHQLVEKLVRSIIYSAQTGNLGDGKIFISDEEAIAYDEAHF